MHALTGWIPEIIRIPADDSNFNAGGLFEQLQSALSEGRCLITVMSSNELSEDEVNRAGLVGNHAYAVLNMREIDVSVG